MNGNTFKKSKERKNENDACDSLPDSRYARARWRTGYGECDMNVSWFSAGVSSAVATKLVIAELDAIIYTHIDDQHPDTMRFVRDCEAWFGKSITILQSYYRNVETVSLAMGFINSPRGGGAQCTRKLKRRVRKEWEDQRVGIDFVYFWGMDANEEKRCDGLRLAMPDQQHRFPLIEHALTKEDAHAILAKAGIRRPEMYDLGYQNNNCIGCVKGGMGYWNKIRVDFPAVFAARAAMERRIGGSCLNGTYLDELDPNAGRIDGPICEDCGIFCELARKDLMK